MRVSPLVNSLALFPWKPDRVRMSTMLPGNTAYGKNDPSLLNWIWMGRIINTLMGHLAFGFPKRVDLKLGMPIVGNLKVMPMELLQDIFGPCEAEASIPGWLSYCPDKRAPFLTPESSLDSCSDYYQSYYRDSHWRKLPDAVCWQALVSVLCCSK